MRSSQEPSEPLVYQFYFSVASTGQSATRHQFFHTPLKLENVPGCCIAFMSSPPVVWCQKVRPPCNPVWLRTRSKLGAQHIHLLKQTLTSSCQIHIYFIIAHTPPPKYLKTVASNTTLLIPCKHISVLESQSSYRLRSRNYVDKYLFC